VTDVLPDRAVVLLGEEDVGVLIRTHDRSRFEPSEVWAQRPAGERPVLGQQFEEDPYAAHAGKQRLGVPLWFEHLLPEPESPLRLAVADAVGISPSHGFTLLLTLGEHLPGNVRVRGVDGDISFRTVARRVREADGPDAADPLPLRVSLGGVQFKISARLGKRGIAVPGWDEDGDWIVKFADQAHADLPAVEFATMSWAAASGIQVPSIRLDATSAIAGIEHLGQVAGDYAFAIERYDRSGELRIHQEDFAQVLDIGPGNDKYSKTNIDTIVKVTSTLAPEDVDELLARIVFCVVSGNDDAHAKNWSLWYPDPTRARLSPAYDLVSTLCFPQYSKNPMALKLAGARTFEDVDLSRFRRLSERTGLDASHVEAVVRTAIERQVAAWATIRERAETPQALRTFLDTRLERLPLVKDAGLA
jgi:serine/threonine-protein kinase HipA